MTVVITYPIFPPFTIWPVCLPAHWFRHSGLHCTCQASLRWPWGHSLYICHSFRLWQGLWLCPALHSLWKSRRLPLTWLLQLDDQILQFVNSLNKVSGLFLQFQAYFHQHDPRICFKPIVLSPVLPNVERGSHMKILGVIILISPWEEMLRGKGSSLSLLLKLWRAMVSQAELWRVHVMLSWYLTSPTPFRHESALRPKQTIVVYSRCLVGLSGGGWQAA